MSPLGTLLASSGLNEGSAEKLSLLLTTLLLLFLFLLVCDDPPGNPESIVFLEVIILMLVAADQQVWVRLLQLVQEAVVCSGNGHLVQVKVRQFLAVLDKLLNAEFAYLLALAQLNMLQVWHRFDDQGKSCISDRRARDLESVHVLQARLD